MECYVDAGPIVKVRGVTARDCAHLALVELGERAKSPITVHPLPIGDEQIYILDDGEIVGTLEDERIADSNSIRDAFTAGRTQPEQRCVICGCTDLRSCPGGCYWLHVTDGPLNICSRCGGD